MAEIYLDVAQFNLLKRLVAVARTNPGDKPFTCSTATMHDGITHPHVEGKIEGDDDDLQRLFAARLLSALSTGRDKTVFKISDRGFTHHDKLVAAESATPQSSQTAPSAASSTVKIFISHRSDDIALVTPLVDLLLAAFAIEHSDIRCTSLAGHKLAGGDNTDESLRREVHDSQVVIAVISPAFLKSQYCIFELGGRWGAQKPLIPLVTPQTSFNQLKPPLKNLNCLKCDSSDLHSLVQQVADAIAVPARTAAVYNRHLCELIDATANSPTPTPESARIRPRKIRTRQARPPEVDPAIAEIELEVLKTIAKGGGTANVSQLQATLNVSELMVLHLGEQLQEKGLVEVMRHPAFDTVSLTRLGRKLLADLGLL